MAKKQSIPENIQKQFEKPQFREGDAVFFVWLGSKKYGYVTTFKKVNWGIQYTVESEGVRYPCGIEIKTYKTTYTTGCIRFDDTRSIGQQELITNSKRAKSAGSNNSATNAIQSSINGNTSGNGKKRKNSELDAAVQRQRDFLNGFISK
jgi:hypothetical protein